MESSNLKVNGNCIQCGSCLGCGFDFLSSSDTGDIRVRPGTILEVDGKEIKSLKDVCPVDAFELVKLEGMKSGNDKQLAVSILEEIKNFSGCTIPTIKDIPYVKEEYSIDIPVASGEYRYEYSSDTAAEKAGLREFDSKMFSQIDNYILKIMTQYRVKYIKPYYSKKNCGGKCICKNKSAIIRTSKIVKGFFGKFITI